MKKVMLILLLSAALGVSAEEPPCLIVRLTDSSEQSVKISEFGKLSFESSEMLLTYKNLSSISYPISTISKIYFQNIASTDIRQSVEEKISIYPNPAPDKIRLNNINT